MQLARISATGGIYTASGMSFATPPNPANMSTLEQRGGKIIVYHGVGDPIFSVDDSETWYCSLQANHDGHASDFARFFRVPGMGHCAGGPSTDQFDALNALVSWVEHGVAPASIKASARGPGNPGGVNGDVPATWTPNRTRPLCPYPSVARYKGTGDVESAGSFTCQ